MTLRLAGFIIPTACVTKRWIIAIGPIYETVERVVKPCPRYYHIPYGRGRGGAPTEQYRI